MVESGWVSSQQDHMAISHFGMKARCEDHSGATVICAEDSETSDLCMGLVSGSFDMLLPCEVVKSDSKIFACLLYTSRCV